MNLLGKKILVTGGAGLIGSHLVKSLLKKGATVRVVDQPERESAHNISDCIDEVEYIMGDLRLEDVAQVAVKGIDIVYHLAARVGGALYTQSNELQIGIDNMKIDRNILEAIRQERIQAFQYTSSGGIYDRTEGIRIPTPELEAWKGEPDSFYGMVKLLGERMSILISKEIDSKVAIIRLFPTYGEGEDYSESGRVIPQLIRKVLCREPYIVQGDGSQIRSFLHVTDAARAMLTAIENIEKINLMPANVGSPDAITIRDLAFLIAKLSPYPDKPTLRFNLEKSVGSFAMVPDITLIRNLTGWTQVIPLKKGLAKLFSWYQRLYGLS